MYTKTKWLDHVVDTNKIDPSTGKPKVIQEGTPVSAGNLNKIESGIEDAHKQLEQAARETVSLPYGTSVINSPDGSPLDVEIQGRTLISMGNSPLEGGKKYVLADPKTAVVIDGTTYKGVAKFEGKNSKAKIVRIANFEGKVSGSMVENPHVSKQGHDSVLKSPSTLSFEAQWNYDQMRSVNNVSNNQISTINGNMAQNIFSFNLIEEVERKLGKIPNDTLEGKVLWLKNNVNRVNCNWWGFGHSPTGNKATLAIWEDENSLYAPAVATHTKSTVDKLVYFDGNISNNIDSKGLIHFLVYAEASDGVKASVINTDYVELEIELKVDANLMDPRVPLYEVSQTEYDKILIDWDVNEIQKRYPAVEGVKHLQNPIITTEGDNLLPPFPNWAVNEKVTIHSAYEATLYPTDRYQNTTVTLEGFVIDQKYTISAPLDGGVLEVIDGGTYIVGCGGNGVESAVFTATKSTYTIRYTNRTSLLETKLSKPMLVLGDKTRPFSSRHLSSLCLETILRGFNGINDMLYQEDGRWKVLKRWGEVVLDGSVAWALTSIGVNKVGFKEVYCKNQIQNVGASHQTNKSYLVDYLGSYLSKYNSDIGVGGIDSYYYTSANEYSVYMRIPGTRTGFSDNYIPTPEEIKAFLNGWKVKTTDTNNKPTAWVSVIDGADAPSQALGYVSSNKAPNYTGYRLLYQLLTPKVVDVTAKMEGALSVTGQTQVTVNSGVIIREKVAKIPNISGSVFINRKAGDDLDNPLSYRVLKVLNVYKGSVLDSHNWNIETLSNLSHGLQRLKAQSDVFDSKADYYVTYLALDKEKLTTNPINVLATYNTSLRSTVNDISAKLADVSTLTSVQERYLYKLLLAAKANGWSV